MPKKPQVELLTIDALGDLARYGDDELLRLREKLIDNATRIHRQSAHLATRIKEFNQARTDLQHELAENARSMRAVKHVLGQRARTDVVVRPRQSATRRR